MDQMASGAGGKVSNAWDSFKKYFAPRDATAAPTGADSGGESDDSEAVSDGEGEGGGAGGGGVAGGGSSEEKYFEKPSMFSVNPFNRSSSTYNKVATNEEDDVLKRIR